MDRVSIAAELVWNGRAMIGEGPVWHARRQRLLWVDVAAGLIHALDPRTGTVTTQQVGQPVGSIAPTHDGGLVVAVRDGFGLFPADDEKLDVLLETEKDNAANRMNDGKCDCFGRFWAGSMAVDHTPGAGTLYRLESSGDGLTVSAQVSGSTISNGLDWSLDNTQMYYIDSATQRIDVFDFDAPAGRLRNRRPFVVIPHADGLPDGMTVDAEGHVWVALFGAGKVRRYTPTGAIDMEVLLPVTLVTSCAFGGDTLQDLYITTARHRLSAAEAAVQTIAGGLFVCRPGPAGRTPFVFGT
jgi:sugar lactone lactonase YvrE